MCVRDREKEREGERERRRERGRGGGWREKELIRDNMKLLNYSI